MEAEETTSREHEMSKIHYKLTDHEFVRGMDHHRRTHKNFYIAIVFFACLALYLSTNSTDANRWNSYSFTFFYYASATISFAVISYLLLTLIGRRTSARNFKRSPFAQLNLTAEWDKTALTIRHNNGHQRYEWKDFQAWSEDANIITLFYGPQLVIPLPKRAFRPHQQDNFKAHLQDVGIKHSKLMPI
ncbi:YcxB family protein [Rhizobium oryziradicis]|uniref:YcxB-like C-terminal domain-containing protein n=1 Tax=Rhizobium oryziradicis TaxID=1867956 RepID=A0A1Q8ZQN5_9HYPH|nr:YcxB family protein [Rhizobium oryziradicis]OLP44367.1 hypothetical protein BJF95_07450 [Rhizobium oryziradicis]